MSTCINTTNPLRGKVMFIKVGNCFAEDVVLTATGDTVDFTAHGLIEGDSIAFSIVTTTTTVVQDTIYFVFNVTANDFQLSSTDPLGTSGSTLVAVDVDGTATAIEVFREVAGLQSTTLALAGEEIDITNKSSQDFKEVLDKAGTRSVALSGSGFALDEFSQERLSTAWDTNCILRYRLYQEGSAGTNLNVTGEIYWEGCFKVTSLEFTGEFNGAQQISLSLSSSGAVARTKVA